MLLEIEAGREAYISAEKLQDRNYFMYPAYHDALLALIDTVKQHRRARQEERTDYITNIIAFSAPRGGGKTSTMLSFAEVMEERDGFADSGVEGCQELDGTVFRVLPTIVPSVLREGQSILSVVLSRMYHFAEKVWSGLETEVRRDFGMTRRTGELAKSKLLYNFQVCLNGINALNAPDGPAMDLTRLHEISDGAFLRQNFYQLTHQLLEFAGCPDGFLVICLDDADSQVGHGYEMLEDIRKYLVVPNLIILMAADFDMLRQVVMKHHYEEFQSALHNQLIDSSELQVLTGKYLDKLIPPLNLIYLPRTEWHSIHRGDNFKIHYMSEQEVIWPKKDNLSFQSAILRQIYLKTGLVFVAHTSYQNSIIPTTLRGLKQMLEILTCMPDIPTIREQDKKDSYKLAVQVEKQAGVALENLMQFYDYFVHDWINVKIKDKDDLRFIRTLEQSPASDRLKLTIDHLKKRWGDDPPFHLVEGDYSYAAMTEYIEKAVQESRSQRDYLFFFVVRTLMNLESHHRVWIEKANAAARYKKNKSGLFLFDLSTDKTYLSNTYFFADFYKDAADCRALVPITANLGKELLNFNPNLTRCEIMLLDTLVIQRRDNWELSYLHIFNMLLELGSPRLYPYVPEDDLVAGIHQNDEYKTNQQCRLYNAQEAALFIASNWEVQHLVLTDWNAFLKLQENNQGAGESPKSARMAVKFRTFFDNMDTILRDMNQGSIWTKGKFEGCGQAFRDAVNERVIDMVDFDYFYDEIYQSINKIKQTTPKNEE